VVACNTVSAVALDMIRIELDLPVLGVILPGARAAVAASGGRPVGVLGTTGTIASGAYPRAISSLSTRTEVIGQAAPLFVPLAEEGWTDGPVARGAVETYLASLRKSGIDTLILGCTHYPLLRPLIADVMGPDVTLVDSAEETAREVATLLAERGLARAAGTGTTSFFVTDVPDRFIRIGQRFLGARVESAVRIERRA